MFIKFCIFKMNCNFCYKIPGLFWSIFISPRESVAFQLLIIHALSNEYIIMEFRLKEIEELSTN